MFSGIKCKLCGKEPDYLLQCYIGKEPSDVFICKKCGGYSDNCEPLAIVGENVQDIVYKEENLKRMEENIQELIKKCNNCGTGLLDIQDCGKLGCPQCYDQYSDVISNIISAKVKKDTVTKVDKKTKEKIKQSFEDGRLLMLQEKLERAVKDENYELASEIHNLIAKIEKGKQ